MSGISNDLCLPTCSITMRTGRILDSRRTRPQVVQQKFALRVKAGFNPFRESAGCTIVMRWQRRFKSCFSESQILILKPGQAHSTLSASIFADRRISPPTSVKEKEIHPFNVVHDDLANYRTEFSGPTDFLACAELVDTPSYRISFC